MVQNIHLLSIHIYVRQSHSVRATVCTKAQSSCNSGGSCTLRYGSRLLIEGGSLTIEGLGTDQPDNVANLHLFKLETFHGDPPFTIIVRSGIINSDS
jgi:hypothetical protein